MISRKKEHQRRMLARKGQQNNSNNRRLSIGFEDNTPIRDVRKEGRQLIQVHMKDKKQNCITDIGCIHVGFAL